MSSLNLKKNYLNILVKIYAVCINSSDNAKLVKRKGITELSIQLNYCRRGDHYNLVETVFDEDVKQLDMF